MILKQIAVLALMLVPAANALVSNPWARTRLYPASANVQYVKKIHSARRLATISMQTQHAGIIQVPMAPAAFVKEWVWNGRLANATYIFGHELRVNHDRTYEHFDTGIREALEKENKKENDKNHTPCKWEASIYTMCPGSSYAFAGFIATQDTAPGTEYDIYVSWRGTQLQEEWAADADMDLEEVVEKPAGASKLAQGVHIPEQVFATKDVKPEHSKPQVHRGFAKLYRSAKTTSSNPDASTDSVVTTIAAIIANKTATSKLRHIYVTGHSLGAALATISAWRLAVKAKNTGPFTAEQVRLVAFSCPRVGNSVLANGIFRHLSHYFYRIFTDGDLVAALPLYMGPRGLGTQPFPIAKKDLTAAALYNNRGELDLEKLWKYLVAQLRHNIGTPKNAKELFIAGVLAAMDSIVPDIIFGRGLNAKFCHSGVGIGLTHAALPNDLDDVVWDVGNHHNLNLIIYLLEPNDDHLAAVKQDLLKLMK